MNKTKVDGIVRHVLGIASGLLAGSSLAQYITPDVIEGLAGLIGGIVAIWFSANAPEKKAPDA